MKNKFMMATLLASSVLFGGCEKPLPITVEGNDLIVTIPENPEVGQVLGIIVVNITNADNTSMILNDGPLSNYISLDESNGEVTVTDPSIFDFETQEFYSASVSIGGTNRDFSNGITVHINITLTNVIEATDIPTITVDDFEVTIPENPLLNQSIGLIDATIENASRLKFYFKYRWYCIGQ